MPQKRRRRRMRIRRQTRDAPKSIRRKRERRGRGRPQRKPTPWPEGFDLKTKENTDAFLIQYIKTFWEQNPLDARAGGVLNNALRLYCDVKGWVPKAPLQIIQAQTVVPQREALTIDELAAALEDLPLEMCNAIWDRVKKRVAQKVAESTGEEKPPSVQ